MRLLHSPLANLLPPSTHWEIPASGTPPLIITFTPLTNPKPIPSRALTILYLYATQIICNMPGQNDPFTFNYEYNVYPYARLRLSHFAYEYCTNHDACLIARGLGEYAASMDEWEEVLFVVTRGAQRVTMGFVKVLEAGGGACAGGAVLRGIGGGGNATVRRRRRA